MPELRRRFRANRGGHAPGHIRGAFLDCFGYSEQENWYELLSSEDALYFHDPKMQRRWEAMSAVERGRWLIGQLWNCTDILPCLAGSDDFIDLPAGSTYATAVRKLRAEMNAIQM